MGQTCVWSEGWLVFASGFSVGLQFGCFRKADGVHVCFYNVEIFLLQQLAHAVSREQVKETESIKMRKGGGVVMMYKGRAPSACV